MIHGVGLRIEAWSEQLPVLSKTHRLIAVDMPGHGESAPIAIGSQLPDFVAWLRDFFEDMELAAANVAGHSMGALIAGGAAASLGAKILRVACLNGVFCRSPAAKAAVLARAAAIPGEGVDVDGPLQRWFGDEGDYGEARAQTRHWLSQVDRMSYATAYGAFAGGDSIYADAWPNVRCPALFLTGEGDPNSTPQMAKDMAALAPNSMLRIIPGHRHMVPLTAPDLVNGIMKEWLERPLA